MDLETARRTSDVQANDPTLGNPKARLTLHLFADFQCPHSRDLELSGAHRKLQEEHLEAGDVKLVFVNYPVVGDDSKLAAMASHQVWRQAPQAYWAWHKAMFEAQGEENSGWASREGILRIAQNLDDIDGEALEGALDSREHEAQVERDLDLAQQWGVEKTPTLFLEGERVAIEDVNAEIERARG